MRHRVAGYKLSRDAEHRLSDRRNLAAALFMHGQITTTLPKAKMVQPFVERLITLGRRGDLAARRRAIALLGGDRVLVKNDLDESVRRNKYGELLDGPRLIKKLFDEIAPKYRDRPGGYTRIIKTARHRIGDGSDLVILQLVGFEETGPQVSGQYSRRREKAHRRTEFAARLRKARAQARQEKAEAAATSDESAGSNETSPQTT